MEENILRNRGNNRQFKIANAHRNCSNLRLSFFIPSLLFSILILVRILLVEKIHRKSRHHTYEIRGVSIRGRGLRTIRFDSEIFFFPLLSFLSTDNALFATRENPAGEGNDRIWGSRCNGATVYTEITSARFAFQSATLSFLSLSLEKKKKFRLHQLPPDHFDYWLALFSMASRYIDSNDLIFCFSFSFFFFTL